MRLGDGRKLAYTEFGAMRGLPMFYLHDAGSSRLEGAFFDGEARRAGFRIIALDRPGVGESDTLPGSTRESSIDDLLEVADALRFVRFGILAVGAGSGIALLAAARVPDRVSIVLGISAILPVRQLHTSYPNRFARLLISSFLHVAITLRLGLRSANPERYISRFCESLSYSDRRLLENPQIREQVVQLAQEAVKKGASGVARDTSLAFSPLYVPVGRLSMPVHLWQGSTETRVLQNALCDFVETLPAAKLHRLNNRGRYFFWRHTEEIFAVAKDTLLSKEPHVIRTQIAACEESAPTEVDNAIAMAV